MNNTATLLDASLAQDCGNGNCRLGRELFDVMKDFNCSLLAGNVGDEVWLFSGALRHCQ